MTKLEKPQTQIRQSPPLHLRLDPEWLPAPVWSWILSPVSQSQPSDPVADLGDFLAFKCDSFPELWPGNHKVQHSSEAEHSYKKQLSSSSKSDTVHTAAKQLLRTDHWLDIQAWASSHTGHAHDSLLRKITPAIEQTPHPKLSEQISWVDIWISPVLIILIILTLLLSHRVTKGVKLQKQNKTQITIRVAGFSQFRRKFCVQE